MCWHPWFSLEAARASQLLRCVLASTQQASSKWRAQADAKTQLSGHEGRRPGTSCGAMSCQARLHAQCSKLLEAFNFTQNRLS